MDKRKYVVAEIIVIWITFECFYTTFSVYFGNALVGSFGGLIFAFFGWLPAIIGCVLIPVNIYLITKITGK